MEITGKIKFIDETKSFGGSTGFKKREIVITTDEQYPQHIMIEATQNMCEILDKYHEGDQVKILINLRGREWVNPQGETKYFNSIQMWKIEKKGGNINEPLQQRPSNSYAPAEDYGNDAHDDLPF